MIIAHLVGSLQVNRRVIAYTLEALYIKIIILSFYFRRKGKCETSETLMFPEAVLQRFSLKKVFLKISQNSQENTSARGFFNKVADLKPAITIKNGRKLLNDNCSMIINITKWLIHQRRKSVVSLFKWLKVH